MAFRRSALPDAVINPKSRSTSKLSRLDEGHLAVPEHQKRLEDAHAELAKRKEELVKVKEDLGPTNPDTLTAASKYALALVQVTDFKAAESIQRYIWDTSARVLGGQHPDTLLAMDNLAVTVRHLGKRSEAMALAQQAMKVKTAFGIDDPRVTSVYSNCASAKYLAGNTQGAVEIERTLLETRKKALGPDHPDTLAVMNNLAASLKDMGDLQAAEELYREVLQLRQSSLGPHHTKTVIAMKTLSACLRQQGNSQGAAEVQQQMLEVEKQKFGPRHPRTLNTMQQLASNFREHGECSRADELENLVRTTGKAATREDQKSYGR